MEFNIEEQIENIRVVDEKRDYWFVRSYGGELYEDFLDHNYVGLGFNNVPYKYITDATSNDASAFERLQKFINENTKYKKSEATKWANQLIRFESDVKIGDMVIVPNKNSDEYSFGLIESKTKVVEVKTTFTHNGSTELFPEKRKQIKWLKTVQKEDLRGELRSISFTHQALSNINAHSEQIEGNISSLYIKENRMYLTIQVDQHEDINAFDLQRFLEGLTYFYKEFCKEYGIEDNEDLFIKIKVQSWGKVALRASVYGAILGLAGLIILSNHNTIELSILGQHLKATNDGFLESVSDFKDRDAERQMKFMKLQDSIKNLKAHPTPDSVSKDDDSTSQAPTTKDLEK